MKSVYFKNKCNLVNVFDTDNEDDLIKYDGQLVLGKMHNGYYHLSYLFHYKELDGIKSDDENIVYPNKAIYLFPFDKATFESLQYIFECVRNNITIDVNHPVHSKIEMFNEANKIGSIEAYLSRRNNVQVPQMFESIIPISDLLITYDSDDEDRFKDNVLNLLTYDETCDYYTNSQILFQDDKGEIRLGQLSFYDKTTYNGWVITDYNLSHLEGAKYFNFLYNINCIENNDVL